MKPIEFKTFPAEFNVSESGLIEGYLSTFGNVDDGGDMVEAGAFAKTLSENLPKGNILLLTDHRWQTDAVIGVLENGHEDDKGLFTSWRLTGLPRADEVKTLIKEGIIKAMSMGYQAILADVVDGVRHLKEVRLFEGSVVPFPMNNQAIITGVKAMKEWFDLHKRIELSQLFKEEVDNINEAMTHAAGSVKPPTGEELLNLQLKRLKLKGNLI